MTSSSIMPHGATGSSNHGHNSNNMQELLNPSTLWGTIGQSYSFQGSSGVSGIASHPFSGVVAMAAPGSSSSGKAFNATAGSAGGNDDSLGGLWNFGGFDVDALTNESSHSTNIPLGMMRSTTHATTATTTTTGRHHEADVSSLSSAFGNFGLQQQGPSLHQSEGSGANSMGMNQLRGQQHQGGHSGFGGGAGLYSSHAHPHQGSQHGITSNKFVGRYGTVHDDGLHGPNRERHTLHGLSGYEHPQTFGQQPQPGMIGYGAQGQQGGGYGTTGHVPPHGAPPIHHQGGGNQGNRYGDRLGAGARHQGLGGYSESGQQQGSGGYGASGTQQGTGGGFLSIPVGTSLSSSMAQSLQQPQMINSNDGLSGPYPPSFQSVNGAAISAYHQGPGWDQLPRWGGGAGQGYGTSGGGANGSSVGYATGGAISGPVAGGGRGDSGRSSYPPYPMPPTDYMAAAGGGGGGGGYDQYQSTAYKSTAVSNAGGYGGSTIGSGTGVGGGRSFPSFSPPSHFGSESSTSPTGRKVDGNIPSGPYPPSFQAVEYEAQGHRVGGAISGALSSVLQSAYNPQLPTQQGRYPSILGGSSDPMHIGGMVGKSPNNDVGSAVGGNNNSSAGFHAISSGIEGFSSSGGLESSKRMQSSISTGNISPASSNISSGTSSHPSTGTGATGANAVVSSGGIYRTVPSFAPVGVGAGMASASGHGTGSNVVASDAPILPKRIIPDLSLDNYDDDDFNVRSTDYHGIPIPNSHDSLSKKREWLMSMNATLESTPIGQLDPNTLPLSTIMNGWAKQKSSEGARMVEMWLDRVHSEYNAENPNVLPTARMYTMAVDAWAKSNGGAPAARRAEALLERMDRLYREGGGRHEALKPTTGIFNAVINAWARSREKIAPQRAEQILSWMETLRDKGGEELDISPDKYTFNTVIHAYAKSGAKESATKAHRILDNMNQMYREGNSSVKPDTITYNVVINAYAKSGGKGAAQEAENLLQRMHLMYDQGDLSVKPNVVTYGAVIDAFAKSMERNAAARADALLANMVALHQSDPVRHADLRPNTYVFNTVINAWAKSKEKGAAAKAEEMLIAMDRLHASGFPGLKPDAFTYTAVIDAYAKSGYRGAASRADLLLDQMEAKYASGDQDLKPNTFTYNAVINALAKSGEQGAAARAERVLHNMVNRLRNNGNQDVKPTTINFNTVLDAWAKSGEGEAAAERAEAILEWMDRLNKAGNADVKPDTITFNAVIDAWARSGCKRGPQRAEQILNHMDELYRGGNVDVKPDTYTYNTLINALAKSGDGGSAARAEEILKIMEERYANGDTSYKPNTRSHTSVIDALAKSGEPGAARRAEMILNNLRNLYEAEGDPDIKPNVYTANAVMNACAFTKHEEDREEALAMAFRVFHWLDSQTDIKPDAYTFTIMLSVCANLILKEDCVMRFENARMLFQKCCDSGHVNDHVLWKLKLTVTEAEYYQLVGAGTEIKAADLDPSWSRTVAVNRRSGDNRNNNWLSRNRGRNRHM